MVSRLSGGYDCDMAICRNLASPKRRLMVGLRCSWLLRLSPGGFECSCCMYDQTDERMRLNEERSTAK